MRHTTLPLLAASALLLTLLSGCGSSSGIRVTEGSEQIGSAPKGSTFVTDTSTIVHVNEFERLATLRNARNYPEGTFLETRDRQGNKTALLKTRATRESGLRTADILEGLPQINDRGIPVSPAERTRLDSIYRDPAAE